MSAILLTTAKRRASIRRSSSGGTMFVVAMTLSVLSAIGAWAIQSAALEVRMAGYERQNTQTHYLSEYGVLAALEDVQPVTASAVLNVAFCGANIGGTVTRTTCMSLPPAPSTAPSPLPLVARTCFRWEGAQSTVAGAQNFTGLTALDSSDAGVTGAPGSLGATNTSGDFSAEITEVVQAPAQSGFSQGGNGPGMAFYWATMTSFGRTRQTGDTSANSSLYGSEGDEQLRTRVEIGPLQQIVVGACQ